MKQDIRFCATPDGVKLAYAKSGTGPVLVKAANWLSHLEYELESPVWRHWIRELSKHHTLVRYDERGCGLSDWSVEDFSVETWVTDLETVVDKLKLDRFPLLGISQGGPVAITYAVKHPERVSHLILYGSYAQGRSRRNFLQDEADKHLALSTIIKVGWGQANPAFRKLFGNLFMPDASPELLQSFEKLQRISTSAENASKFYEAFGKIFVTHLLSKLTVPTLILQAKDDALLPFEASRQLATMIPDSKYSVLESKNHILLEDEPAWKRFLVEIHDFLGIKYDTKISSPEISTDKIINTPLYISEGQNVLHYKILNKLGEGGMSVVYKAEDTKLKREVAIKLLPYHIASNEEERKRFLIEARAAASLNHPNIATIYSIEETSNQTFIAMEYIDGVEVKEKVVAYGKGLPLDETINIATQIADGLEAAHKKGIVHRDIKSQNIMITKDGKVKIMDFGLAKIRGSSQLTKMGTTIGTVAYMSPEQAMGKELDHRTDIWSFGVVFYEMLTGQLPFKGEYDQAIVYSIINEEPEPIVKLRDDLPLGLEGIIRKSLSKDPDVRYQNISDLLNDIKHPDPQVSILSDSANKTPSVKKQRKLSAIMFTDMVGYSALAQKNESLALELLETQKQILRSIFPKYDGREIETIGDAFFIEFNSTLEAVNCAIEIQKTMYERNAAVDDSEKIILRLGLHVGDVVHVGSQVHGDGVNIAARLEPLSPPGGICLSEDVVRQVQNKIELSLRNAGIKKLKNINTPINIYYIILPWEEKTQMFSESKKYKPRVRLKRSVLSFILVVISVVAVLLVWKYFNGTSKLDFSNRIAVLPLVNISQNSDDDYFVDGMTEELISQLAKISGLNVIARTSVMKYKNARLNTADIGNELGVGTILEGSVRTAVNKARVSVQLIDVKTQESIWAQDYDREVKDIFNIQSDIALSIADQLKIQLLTTEKQQLEKRGTENADAYRSYLLGKYQLNQRTPESIYNGVKFFNEAIEYDPEFALAYVGLTDCYTLIVGAAYGYLPRQEAITKANEAINKALELDPTSAEAYNSLAYLKFRLEWDWKEAEKNFRKAIDLQHGYASAYERYALLLACIGKKDEAISMMEKAYKLDPLSPSVSTGVGRMYHFAGYYDKAIKQYEKTLKMNPNYVEAEFALSITYEQKKMYDMAILHLEKSIEISNGRLIMISILGRLYAKTGNIQEALKVKDELKRLQSDREVSPFYFAVIDAALGNKKAAIDSLYKAYDERFGILVYTIADNLFTNLLDDKRFIDLLKKMDFEL